MDEPREAIRPDIAQSWRRSTIAGLQPEDDVRLEVVDYDEASRLLRAAEPVLDDFERQIRDVPVGSLLADRRAVIVRRHFGQRALEASGDGVGAYLGAIFDEEHTGTNAISTPFEDRRAQFVHRGEHYLEGMKSYECYGAPILNPVTRRVEGVLDLMASAGTDTALMRAVVDRAVRDIALRLADDYDDDVAAAVAMFNSMRRGSKDALILMRDDLVMQNARSIDLLGLEDVTLLGGLVKRDDPYRSLRITLANGHEAEVRTRFAGHGAAIFQVKAYDEKRSRIPRSENARSTSTALTNDELVAASLAQGHVLISGEPGTGRTTAAMALAGAEASRVDLREGAAALSLLEHALAAGGMHVAEGMEYVESRATHLRLAELLKSHTSGRVIVTSGPQESLADGAETVAVRCLNQVVLAPLRDRVAELPKIVESMLKELGASNARLTLGALEALQAHAWPGNFDELRMVLADTLTRRSTGDITLADLPTRLQGKQGRTNLTVLERAERDAIVRTLALNKGNKAQAAQQLGLSRSTLYLRLRYFGIT